MKITRKPIQADDVTEGSGNVFADLDLPNADQELAKARLRLELARIIKNHGLAQD